jgi:SAM-dependent methyltransferase
MSFHERMMSWAYRAVPVTSRTRIRRFAGALTRSAERHGLRGLAHAVRLAGEKARYADQQIVHDLPPIFHYWSNRHLLPMLREVGIPGIDGFFVDALEACAGRAQGTARLVSLGAGNCDTEVRLALLLKKRGVRDFTLECVDINQQMLERGRGLARASGVEREVRPILGDFNHWEPARAYHAVIANQSLHHVVELESLFDAVRGALVADGAFIVSDMIGRNGHQRWPEALEIVREFWRELPAPYKRNRLLGRQEDEFLDWDCSRDGFEGIRAQDILPLLVERFGFELFFGFGNVIDPFVSRAFGPNFDAAGAWDREFIDRVHQRDHTALLLGQVTPTHMLAIMGRRRDDRPARIWKHLSPAFCLRKFSIER